MEVTEAELEALRSTKAKSGFRGVKVTASRKFQPQVWCSELRTMRALGSFDDAEDAALARLAAMRDGPDFEGPIDYRAKRGTVRCPSLYLLHLHSPVRPSLNVSRTVLSSHLPAGVARRRRARSAGD